MRTRALGVDRSAPPFRGADGQGQAPPIDGPHVTVVGSGDLSLARAAARGVDANEVGRAVYAAIDRGLTILDVAAEDGAERVVGEAVRTLGARDRVVVVTRVEVAAPVLGGTASERLEARLPIAYVQRRIEDSLRATRLDALPLALLPHRIAWRNAHAWDELRGACARMVQEGKVMRWGAIIDEVGVDRDDDASVAGLTDGDGVCAIAVTYNACVRGAERLIAAAAARGIAVLARQPLAGGALAGELGPGVRLAVADDRHSLTDAQLVAIAETIGGLAALVRHVPPAAQSCATARGRLERALTRRPDDVECATMTDLALRFAIDHPGVTCVLPRLHRIGHIDDALAAAAARPLSGALVARFIAELVELTATT